MKNKEDLNKTPSLLHYVKSGYITDIILVIFISLVTANWIAPSNLNADVILNSIMSLQKVTVFYWGQNRLLNVLPFLLSIIKDPGINLAFQITFVSLIFFSLLYVLAFILRDIFLIKTDMDTREVFLLFVILAASLLRQATMFNFVIGHIEYSLPCLMIILLFRFTYNRKLSFFQILSGMIMIFIATGLNNSTILITLSISFFLPILSNYNLKTSVFIGITSIVCFLSWDLIMGYVSGPQPETTYYGLVLSGLMNNMFSLLKNLVESIYVLHFLGLACLAFFLLFFRRKEFGKVQLQTIGLIALFATGWIIVFANNQWVIINEWHFRYSFPVFICTLVLMAYIFSMELSKYRKFFRLLFIYLCSGIVIIAYAAPPASWDNYQVFKKNEYLQTINPESAISLYSGKYWDVWPAVMKDMMNGKNSFGLTHRGEANREQLLSSVIRELSAKEAIPVYCLGSSSENCKEQIKYILGNIFIIGKNKINRNCTELFITYDPVYYRISGESRRQIGNFDSNNNSIRAKKGENGFLHFGPYIKLLPGRYSAHFKIKTGAEHSYPDEAGFIDIIAEFGEVVLAEKTISGTGRNYNINFEVPDNILKNVEFRVFSSGLFDIELQSIKVNKN